MDPKSYNFLESLLITPGPSGFETAPANVWRSEANSFADRVEADVNGNSWAALNPDTTPRVMFAGHIDEIGLMIVHVDDEGFLYFKTIGGWDTEILPGQRVAISGKNGPVKGVVGKKAVHLIKAEERTKISKISDLWI
ncbi:MAG: M42 family peptidase, partial [Gemmatimonadota bacterium]|nr:M42 family peptidase [Gemmatimonadota bacterium]